MLGALLEQLGRDGASHDVARRKLVDEPLPVEIADQCAVAAQSLGQQRSRHAGAQKDRGMELHELDIRTRHAGPQRHGQTVSGRLQRVGRRREQLSGPAGGEQHVMGVESRRRRPSGASGVDALTAALGDEEIERVPALPDLVDGGAHLRRPAPARSRRRWRHRRRGRRAAASGRLHERGGVGRRDRGRTRRPSRSVR